jgi:hypothetical protein
MKSSAVPSEVPKLLMDICEQMISGDCARFAATAHRSVLLQSTRFYSFERMRRFVSFYRGGGGSEHRARRFHPFAACSAELEKLGDSLPLSSQKNARSQYSPRAQFAE